MWIHRQTSLKMAKFVDIFIFLALFEVSNGYKLNRESNFCWTKIENVISDHFANRSREKAAKHYLRKQKEIKMRSRADALRQDIR